MFSAIHKKIVHDPRLTCSDHILEIPLMNFFGLYCWFVHLQNDFSLAQFYAAISNQIKQWSHLEKFVVWVLGIISRIIIIYVEKLSQCIIPFQSHSHGNSFISKFGRPVHFVWDILTIAIVIWILKNTSVSLAFLFIDFPLCWTLYRFVWLAICSRILPSENSLKYCNGVISAALSGGGLSYFPLNEVSKTIASFFLHL